MSKNPKDLISVAGNLRVVLTHAKTAPKII